MRGMRKCVIAVVAAPGTPAANQLHSTFARRREVTVTRLGSYTRVVLIRHEAALPGAPVPRWA